MEQYGKIIARLRKEHNMTQAELGAKLNVTFQAVSKWENDQSQPDFSTMVQIAELFQVPLTIFLNENSVNNCPEKNQTQQAELPLGYCTSCGNPVYKETLAEQYPRLICKKCSEDKKRTEEEKQRQIAQNEKLKTESERRKIISMRNKGFIWAAVITGILIVLGIVFVATAKSDQGSIFLGSLILWIFSYTFVAQMFWDGFIFDACLFGGKVIGTPGIIFSFDLDGFIFLIAMKIVFALLKLLVFILTFLLTALFAVLCSPFTFIPALCRINREIKETV